MKKTFQLIAQGIVIGLSTAITLFFLIKFMDDIEPVEHHETVKRHYYVDEAEYTDPAPSSVQGARETTITFKVRNKEKKKLARILLDIEFFDSKGNFLFDSHHGSPWGELHLPPKPEDNISVNVLLPETIDFGSIDKVTVEVYELSI